VAHVQHKLGVAERRACRVLSQPRSTQRYRVSIPNDEAELVKRMTELATEYGRYGYRRITALLQREGWRANHKRIERLWRREGLKVPQRQPKRGRLWLTDGSCLRRRAEHKDHVWSYDFVLDRTHDGRPVRTLVVADEYTRECLAARVARRLRSEDVIDTLADLFVQRGTPEYLRSDNGAEFTAKAVRQWLEALGVTTLFIAPGSPWENGKVERSHRTDKDEFYQLIDYRDDVDLDKKLAAWERFYNYDRPHSSHRGKTPYEVLREKLT